MSSSQWTSRRVTVQLRGISVIPNPLVTVMAFQPIVNIATGETVGAEALARFKIEPIRAPDEWFAEALEVGLATEMEMAAVSAALAEFDRLPPHTFLAMNVSPAIATTAALHSLLAGYPADRLVLELTEHSRVDDYDDLRAGIEPLRLRGIRIALTIPARATPGCTAS